MKKRKKGILDRIESTLDIFLMLLMLLMVALVNMQIFTRYLLGFGTAWSEVLSRYTFIWIAILGAASALRKLEHFTVDFVTRRLPKGSLKPLFFVTSACTTVFLVVMVTSGIQQVFSTWTMWAEGIKVRMGIIYLVIPIGGILMIVFLAEILAKTWKGSLQPYETRQEE